MTRRSLSLAAVAAGALLAPASAQAWSDKPKPPTPAPTPPVTVVERFGCDGLLIPLGGTPPTCVQRVEVPVPTPATSCTSRRLLTIRLIENRTQHLRSATATMAGRAFTAARRSSDGRLVMGLDFRGLRGPDVVVLHITAINTAGKMITGDRIYRTCRLKDSVTVNFSRVRL